MPQNLPGQLAHRVLREKLEPILDLYTHIQGLDGLVLGSSRGGTPTDLYWLNAKVLEIGRDRFNSAAIAGGDIKLFHDCVPWGQLMASLVKRGLSIQWAAAAVRFHRCPTVFLELDGHASEAMHRRRALFTGAASAATLARLPVEDAILEVFDTMWRQEWGFELQSGRLWVTAWADNLYTYAGTKEAAVAQMHALEKVLNERWHCYVKADSRTLQVSANAIMEPEPWYDDQVTEWTLQSHLQTLGPIVSATGGPAADLTACEKQIWGQFYANVGTLRNPHIPCEKGTQA